MNLKKIFLVATLTVYCISLNSCILKLPFQIVGNVIDDVTPF
ncbi:hypothetical protein [Francisella philomiragia]|nr:hypothetical protein [Francisella philomiragia]